MHDFSFFLKDAKERTMESAATTLQLRFETALQDQEPLLIAGCEGTSTIYQSSNDNIHQF